MRDLSLILFFILIFTTDLNAQILNIDRENGQDTIPRKFSASIGLDFASDKQQNDFVELSSSTELDFFLKNNNLFILFVYDKFFLRFNDDVFIYSVENT